MRHTVEVFGCGLYCDLIAHQIVVKVEMREHLNVSHACIRPHLANISLVFQSSLKFDQKLLDRWLVLLLPFNLTCLFLANSLVKHAREVILVDHLSQVSDDFALQLIGGSSLGHLGDTQ